MITNIACAKLADLSIVMFCLCGEEEKRSNLRTSHFCVERRGAFFLPVHFFFCPVLVLPLFSSTSLPSLFSGPSMLWMLSLLPERCLLSLWRLPRNAFRCSLLCHEMFSAAHLQRMQEASGLLPVIWVVAFLLHFCRHGGAK